MRRRGKSPQLVEGQARLVTDLPRAVAERIISGDPAFQVWRQQAAMTLNKLSRRTGLGWRRLLYLDSGYPIAEDEAAAIADALNITVELLMLDRISAANWRLSTTTGQAGIES